MQDTQTKLANTSKDTAEANKDWFTDFQQSLVEYAPKVVAALVILIFGLFFVNMIVKLARKLMKKRDFDVTLQKFLGDLISWTLKILLFVIVASKLGIETTSFAAIIGAAGLAIGLALQGSLSNFAGGVLIMVFKPYKIGDFIEAQGISGTVKEIQIFTTYLNMPGNKLAIVPNGKLSNGNIINYSAESTRRVDMVFGVAYDSDIQKTKDVFLSLINNHPKILKEPAPIVNVSELADSSINFIVRPWVNTPDYWEVFYYMQEKGKEALDEAGIEIPYPHTVEIQKQG